MSGPRKIRLSTTPTPGALAELQLGDIVYLDGPFRYLNSCWKFSPRDEGCLIDFSIDFEFRSLLLRKIMGPLFNEVVRRSVASFVARADSLYGNGGQAGEGLHRRVAPSVQK